MKTLDQTLKEIRKMNITASQKKELCIKAGMRPRDIDILEFSGFFNESTPLTFGVEIECNVLRENIERRLNPAFNFYYESYNHNDTRHYYKFTTDGSVHGDSPIECVSPILDNTTDGFKSLETCCKVLNDAGATVNRTCGLHVHVGIAEYKGEEVVNIYKNYQKLEAIIDSFMAPSRRGDGCTWCHTLQGYDFSNCHDTRDLESLFGYDRYQKVNPMAYSRHRTVEFRQHQGTVEYKKISMWVNFCCKLVEWSKENVLTKNVTSINDVPFLNDEEKRFFNARIREFAQREGRSVAA